MKAGNIDIVAVFHDESTFRANGYYQFYRLGNDEQVLYPKIVGRVLIVSESVCPCHGKMVDSDTGKPCCVILKYSKNYDVYWTGEDVAIQLQDTHIQLSSISTLVVFPSM